VSRVLDGSWSSAAGRAHHRTAPLVELLDEQLVERAGTGGDNQAFAELVRRHQGKVRGLLLRLTANPPLADDLAQEVFLRAYRGLVGFEGRARFSTWLYRIAYNVFLNHRTRSKELSALPLGFESQTAAPDGDLSPTRLDLRRDLAGAIAALPERYRAVVTLYYLEDVSYPEIAEVLDLPLGTVKTHLHRAKKLLRQHLGGLPVELADEVAG
jgi:RNA polymerase sigma-70 factor (ECF subfamily)